MKKKSIKQPSLSVKKTISSPAPKTTVKNSKYQLDQYEINPLDEEGGINSFQIYDSLTKQVHDGRQLMPQPSRFDQDQPAEEHKRNSTQGKDDQDVDEFEDDPNFFEKRTGKKRSLTDEYQKFNAKKSELMYSGKGIGDGGSGIGGVSHSARQASSTNDTASNKQKP